MQNRNGSTMAGCLSVGIVYCFSSIVPAYSPTICRDYLADDKIRYWDAGGNGVKLDSPANRHTFWDGVLGDGESFSTALNAILTLHDAPESAVNDLTVSDWIKESFDAAQHTAYKSPPIGAGAGPFTLTTTYRTAARSLAENGSR
jgi:hypothetical protein